MQLFWYTSLLELQLVQLLCFTDREQEKYEHRKLLDSGVCSFCCLPCHCKGCGPSAFPMVILHPLWLLTWVEKMLILGPEDNSGVEGRQAGLAMGSWPLRDHGGGLSGSPACKHSQARSSWLTKGFGAHVATGHGLPARQPVLCQDFYITIPPPRQIVPIDPPASCYSVSWETLHLLLDEAF